MKHVFPQFFSLLAPLCLSIDGGGAGGGGDGSGGSGGGSGGTGGGAGGAGAGGPPVIDFRTYLDDKGNFTKPDWAGEEKGLAGKFTSLPSLIQSYRTLERMNSNGNKVVLPGDNATEAEWNAFYEKLGRPASDDKYDITVPDALKTLVAEDGLKEFRSMAFKSGLNGKQVKAMTDYYFGSVTKANEAAEGQKQQRIQQAETELAKEWGPKDGPKWKENLALAEKGAALAGLSADVLKSTPELSNNPHFIRAMAKIAGITKEAPAAGGREGSGGFNADTAGQIRAIMNDPKHPYFLKEHPDHKRAVADMAALHAKLAGA